MYGFCYRYDVEKCGQAPTYKFNVSGNGNGNGFLRDVTDNTSIPNSEIVISNSGSYNKRMIQLKVAHSSITKGHKYVYAIGDNVFDIIADLT